MKKMKKFKRYLNFPFVAASCAILYVVYMTIVEQMAIAGDNSQEGKVIIEYWDKWSGHEYEAMKAVVDDFNDSQDKIYVNFLSVSAIDQKLILATAGGNPPDVAGLWSHSVNIFSSKGALMPLNRMVKKAGITKEQYIPVYWDMCQEYGFTWALPTTPATIALHWNRKLFREAGLDPDQGPRNLQELLEFADRLTIVKLQRNGTIEKVRFSELTEQEQKEKKFTIVQLGYTPSIPGWFNEMWVYWFGGQLWDGVSHITADSKENLAAITWYGSFARRYGKDKLDEFGASLGNLSSAQSPFVSGKVAMVLQGVWMFNFIEKYNPHLDWNAGPFPSVSEKEFPNVTIAESDVLVIPAGAKHPHQAFEFIKFVSQRKQLEKLNLLQRKFSPLRTSSKRFLAKHPNPHIQVFIALSKSPNVRFVPRVPIWNEYKNEMLVAYNQVFAKILTPADALKETQERTQWKMDRAIKRWDVVKDSRIKNWEKVNDQW